MEDSSPSRDLAPLGQVWLRHELGLKVPPPAVESYLATGSRRTEEHISRTVEIYPKIYAIEHSVAANLRFALRHEPMDLGVLVAAFKSMDAAEIETWVRKEPTGAYSRRAWFLYETFTGQTLDIPDASQGAYIPALDPEKHIVTERRLSKRHRVADNLLGGADLCLTVRRTRRLNDFMEKELDKDAHALVNDYEPGVLARAVNYLFTKETQSSFAIEGEEPSTGRAERFIASLKNAPHFDAEDEAALVKLQNEIVDPRYAAAGWRHLQNFVGETVRGYRERVHFICPKPEDVPSLMEGWMALTRRITEGGIDAVVAAAVSAFAFVFIHPFEDGNGRIHRFLMHHILARQGYVPKDFIFPVSASILRGQHGYDKVLEAFSRPIKEFIEWRWIEHEGNKEIVVDNDTADLYRYFDATVFAEYLYGCMEDTLRQDIKDELAFITIFDRASRGVRDIVDMPDRRASLFIRLCMQNGGRLSATKRQLFDELTDAEVAAMEAAIEEAQRR